MRLMFKYLILVTVASLVLTSCNLIFDKDEYELNCPYERRWEVQKHFLLVPVTVVPNQYRYQVGDTIVFASNFPDSIYDVNMQRKFKIEGFPFRPFAFMFRFRNDSLKRDGFRVNEVHVPEENNPFFTHESVYTDVIDGETVYRDEAYHFQIEMILETPGKYVFLQRDWYNEVALADREGNEEANAIEFEGRCSEEFVLVIQQTGEDHTDNMYNELYYIDENVFRGIYGGEAGRYAPGGGLRLFEREAVFCFEVVE